MWRWSRFLPRLNNEIGGGSKPQEPQYVQPPPPQIIQGPQPSAGETAAQVAQAQLQYNPQLTAQAVQLQGQYGPQLAQQQYDVQKQYGPLYRSLYQQMAPNQVLGNDILAQQSAQRLQNPQGLTPEQEAAQGMFRQRSADELSRSIRSRANVGGTLYGGQAQQQEMRAQAELQNQFAQSDIQNQYQNRAQTLQELIAASQPYFPQVQQVGVPNYNQSATPSPDALMQAIQQSYLVNPAQYQPGTPGTPGYFEAYANNFIGAGRR